MKKIFPVLILAMIFYSCGKEHQNKIEETYTIKTNNNIPDFNSENAFKHIEKQISYGPRNPNSPGHDAALKFFVSEFKKYTGNVDLQNFTYTGYDNEQLFLTNVIAKFNPQSKHRIFISAHWDTRPRADQEKDPALKTKPILGANDGASGVGIILELARLLKEQPVNYGVDLILFDGEDYGKESDLQNYFLGSKYFAAAKPADYQPHFGILLDLVGDKEAVFCKENFSVLYASEVVDMIWHIAEKNNATFFSNQQSSAIEDDHIPLNQAGIKTVDIVDIELVGANTKNPRRQYWHTTKDNIENIGKETLQQVGNVLTNLIYSLDFPKEK